MKGQQSISPTNLFPFIDILAGTIGSLCMVILAISLSETQSPPAGPAEGEISRIAAEVSEKTMQVNAVEKATMELEAAEARVERSNAELTRRLQDSRAVWRAWNQTAQAVAHGDAHRQELDRIRSAQAEALRQIELLRQRLAAVPHRGAQSDRIRIHFTGKGQHLRPVFVECDSQGLLIHEKGDRRRVDWRDMRVSEYLRRLFANIKAGPQSTITFLVRPEGIPTFRLVEAMATEEQVPCGKLPIPGQGEVDLGPYSGPTTAPAQEAP